MLFVPVGEAPHREIEDDPGAEARLEMVELAIGGRRALHDVADRDRPRGPVLHGWTRWSSCARQSPDDELFLILGGDQAAALASWHEPEKVLERATAGRVRAGELGPERDRASRSAGCRAREQVRYLDMPLIQVSSSAIRRRVREGVPIRYLVPDKVADYIATNELYGGQGSRQEALTK